MEIQLLFCLMEGQDENLHVGKVTSELLLITVFGNDVSLGFLRIKIEESIDRIRGLWQNEKTPVVIGSSGGQ
jgi:predicted regulator of Ras-like GTPase activity (Roadblock/LC7/MglB family)